DGRSVYTASRDGTVVKWDWLKLGLAKAQAKPAPADLDKAWQALGNDDLKEAYAALGRLLTAPETTVPLLETKLRPVAAPDAKQGESTRSTAMARSLLDQMKVRDQPGGNGKGIEGLLARSRWTLDNGPRVVHEHPGGAEALDFDPSGKLLASAGGNGSLAVRD